ncbi:hydrolase, NUDIX family [Dictyocaulus viviparus]|uniref:Bis(5'-nucleosyl)-tetraphosphatase [asymmetrical] n=1 Tax=Dictyocaulus viviparus TaxID=29172 RepID=A0A0D8XM80_DICVI|nr:hydrolase, NUDIX family [Dictyocaulus viviparus]
MNVRKIKHIAAGFGFSLFASKDKLFGSGLNNRFQITTHIKNAGLRLQEYYISAKRIHLPIGEFFPKYESCSMCTVLWIHHLFSRKSGDVFAFGLNEDGQCANGSYDIQWKPSKIMGDASGEKITSISGSSDTVLACSENGEIFIWGQNEYGQAGMGVDSVQLNYSRYIPFPGGKISSIGSTSSSCVVSTERGEVYVWGVGILGLGPTMQKLDRPVLMDPPLFGNEKVSNVYAGNTSFGALNAKGRLFVWGQNRYGLLGLDHGKDQYFPFEVFFPYDVKYVSLAGLVVFRRESNRVEFLLLQASYPPHHWTPPKGHVEPGEDEWVAALRETKEEAGIPKDCLKIYEDCHETLKYDVNGVPKTVKYWLAFLQNSENVKLSNEHQKWKWAELDEAIKIAEYAEMGALLRKFKAYIDNLK